MKKNTALPRPQNKNQAGIISIMMAMMLIIIVGLLVLGFAQLSRRTQKETLDSQLSSEAYYAAESGINDAITIITAKLNSGGSVPPKTSCNNPSDANYPQLVGNANTMVDSSANISYSCLLISANSPTLSATVGTSPVSVSLRTSNGNLGRIILKWQSPVPQPSGSNYGQCPNSVNGQSDFPVSTTWRCEYGVVRMDLTATDNLSQSALRNSANTMTTYLVPTKSGGGTGTFNSKAIIGANCSNNGGCTATIQGLAGHSDYSIRLSSVYQSNFNMQITGFTASGSAADFIGQATIDVTGKAQNVLRRIVEVINLVGDGSANNMPTMALMSGDSVCKRFNTYQGASGSVFWINGPNFAGGDNNPLCQTAGNIPPPTCQNIKDVMFTLDYSDSMGTTWQTMTRQQKLEQVAKSFLDSIGLSPGGVHAGIVTFNGGNNPGSPVYRPPKPPHTFNLTDVEPPLLNDLQNTPLEYGTLYMEGLTATDAEFHSNFARPNAKKVMIFMSDGGTFDDVAADVAYAQQMIAQGVEIFTISIADNSNAAVLKEMAGGGGWEGDAHFEADLQNILDSIRSNLQCS